MTEQPIPSSLTDPHSTPVNTTTGVRPATKSQNQQLFEQSQKAVLTVFTEKNAPDHYNNAFEELGLIGIAMEITSISAKLKAAVIRSGDGGESFDRDKLLDILKDVGVYSGLGMICVKTENWTGKF